MTLTVKNVVSASEELSRKTIRTDIRVSALFYDNESLNALVNATEQDVLIRLIPVADDGWELVYAYTVETEAGPGARVGWLDLTTLEDRPGAFLVKGDALALADDAGRLVLYRAALQDTDSRGFYAIDFVAPLGELMERDGALFLEIE